MGGVRRAVLALPLCAVLAGALPTGAAVAASGHGCRSSDLRYAFVSGGPKDFGVFRLRVSGGTCATAHRVAKDWMNAFERRLRAGSTALPRRIDGYAFKSLPAHAAQTYALEGSRGGTTVRFDYVVPNG